MNLLDIRTQLVKLSGRYDLVTNRTDWSDNGADFFIQAGQKFLDRKTGRDHPTAMNTIFHKLSAGEWYVTFENCRSIKEIWANNTTGRSQLYKKDINWLYREFSKTISDTSPGTPLYYCPALLRSTARSDQTDLGTFFNYVEDNSDNLRGILIWGISDEDLVLEIRGIFYSKYLEDDMDENFWTLNASDTLIKAALYQIEVFNRNSEGMKDWLNAIGNDIQDLDMDTVEEGISEFNQIGG